MRDAFNALTPGDWLGFIGTMLSVVIGGAISAWFAYLLAGWQNEQAKAMANAQKREEQKQHALSIQTKLSIMLGNVASVKDHIERSTSNPAKTVSGMAAAVAAMIGLDDTKFRFDINEFSLVNATKNSDLYNEMIWLTEQYNSYIAAMINYGQLQQIFFAKLQDQLEVEMSMPQPVDRTMFAVTLPNHLKPEQINLEGLIQEIYRRTPELLKRLTAATLDLSKEFQKFFNDPKSFKVVLASEAPTQNGPI